MQKDAVSWHIESFYCRFAIPFGFATSLGLAVRALDLPLTATEAGDGES